MALIKVSYVEGETVIHANNLNDIQDEIVRNATNIAKNKTAISTAITEMVAEYDSSKSYIVGDLVSNSGWVYKCIEPATGSWQSSKWQETSLADGILSASEYLELANLMASAYSSSSTYFEGQFVTYGGNVYEAKQEITTAESWTASHWNLIGSAS